MTLRFATPDDAEALEAVHARAFDCGWKAADIVRLMQVMGGFAVVSEDERGVTGFVLARLMAQEAEVLTLAVAPWARRKGLATALIDAAAAHAALRGAETVFLEVASDNASALGLYQGAGFERVGMRRGYYARQGRPAQDALVLRRRLNTPDA